MAEFNLFQLPEELILQVIEYLPAADLASFLRTSKTSWRIAIKTAEKYPIRKILTQFKQASIDDNPEEMLALLPIIRHITTKRNPAVGYEALAQACMGPSAEAVWLLVNDGVPYADPGDLCTTGITGRYECTPLMYAMYNTNPAPLLALRWTLSRAGIGRRMIPTGRWLVRRMSMRNGRLGLVQIVAIRRWLRGC